LDQQYFSWKSTEGRACGGLEDIVTDSPVKNEFNRMPSLRELGVFMGGFSSVTINNHPTELEHQQDHRTTQRQQNTELPPVQSNMIARQHP